MTEAEMVKAETAAHVEQTKAVSDIALVRVRRATRAQVWIVGVGMALLLIISSVTATVTLVHNYQASAKAARQRATTLAIAQNLATELAQSKERGLQNQQILTIIQAATDPTSAFSKANAVGELAAINRAITCINSGTAQLIAQAVGKPVPPLLAGCPPPG